MTCDGCKNASQEKAKQARGDGRQRKPLAAANPFSGASLSLVPCSAPSRRLCVVCSVTRILTKVEGVTSLDTDVEAKKLVRAAADSSGAQALAV